MHRPTLGEKIRQARKELCMTQEELAGKDFTKGFISLVELDKAKPSLESLTILAARLNRPLTFFLEDRLESKRDIDLLAALGEAHLQVGQTTEALNMFGEAIRISQELDDRAREAACHRCLGHAHSQTQNLEAALEAFGQALEIYGELSLPDQAARIHFLVGTVHHRQHKLTQAIEAYRRSLAEAEAAGLEDDAFLLKLLSSLANAYWKVGEAKEARAFYQRAAQTAGRVGDFSAMGSAYMSLGLAYRERGEVEHALEYATRALELFEMKETVQLMADLHNSIGAMHADQGEWDQALEHYRESLRLRQLIRDEARQAYTYTELARYHYFRGELDQAQEFCRRSLDLLDQLKDPLETGRASLVRGLIAKAQGNWDEATRLFEESASIFAGHDTKVELAETYSELGFLYAEKGDTTRSNEFLAKSVSLFKEAGRSPKERAWSLGSESGPPVVSG